MIVGKRRSFAIQKRETFFSRKKLTRNGWSWTRIVKNWPIRFSFRERL